MHTIIKQATKKRRCHKHFFAQRVYIICRHCLHDGVPIFIREEPEESKDGCGTILCENIAPWNHDIEELALLCEECLKERKIL